MRQVQTVANLEQLQKVRPMYLKQPPVRMKKWRPLVMNLKNYFVCFLCIFLFLHYHVCKFLLLINCNFRKCYFQNSSPIIEESFLSIKAKFLKICSQDNCIFLCNFFTDTLKHFLIISDCK